MPVIFIGERCGECHRRPPWSEGRCWGCWHKAQPATPIEPVPPWRLDEVPDTIPEEWMT